LRLWVAAVKINNHFYQVNFYHKEIVFNYFNTEGNTYYSRPGLIIVESLEIEELNRAVGYLIGQNYFETLKKYRSFENIKFYQTGATYKGKSLELLNTLPLPEGFQKNGN
jgi:hypothetical protein